MKENIYLGKTLHHIIHSVLLYVKVKSLKINKMKKVKSGGETKAEWQYGNENEKKIKVARRIVFWRKSII